MRERIVGQLACTMYRVDIPPAWVGVDCIEYVGVIKDGGLVWGMNSGVDTS